MADRRRQTGSHQWRPDGPLGPANLSLRRQDLAGFQGDTLASALIANGVKLVGRSFKYHRPRGILTAGSGEPNALVELRTGARREPEHQGNHCRTL